MIRHEGPGRREIPSAGFNLEPMKNPRIVSTNASVPARDPLVKPLSTGLVTFAPEGEATLHITRLRHWSAEDCAAQVAMGFPNEWGRARRKPLTRPSPRPP